VKFIQFLLREKRVIRELRKTGIYLFWLFLQSDEFPQVRMNEQFAQQLEKMVHKHQGMFFLKLQSCKMPRTSKNDFLEAYPFILGEFIR